MNVRFKIGTKASLNELEKSGRLTVGSIYLCKDTGELYICDNLGTEDNPIHNLILVNGGCSIYPSDMNSDFNSDFAI